MSTEKEMNPAEVEQEEHDSNYQPPPQKTIEEIMAADAEDESLRKYKEALLGEAQAEKIIFDESDPRKVIVKKLALLVADRDPMELDLTGDLTKLKKNVFVIKEGIQYKIRIDFVVQREIVHGLKYVQKTYRMGVPGKSVEFALTLFITQQSIPCVVCTGVIELPFALVVSCLNGRNMNALFSFICSLSYIFSLPFAPFAISFSSFHFEQDGNV
ncbi:rho GDP-dissociation inhibitor 1 isoform X1 [Anopheles gambiae]|uniref:rho GDP-dissociation inhibitor 1 isoform X1 n=1 Tax=Anopheles gambiae TaxID=7165 RepID=UPI0028F3D489|nr:rho GDP-dissociation inhibitor 1 isoform X1 [Anopheles gambiae]XP_061513390.1 rho GDP-dissociation inhibitor 1 isoform X1 [Anopheles gambiae]